MMMKLNGKVVLSFLVVVGIILRNLIFHAVDIKKKYENISQDALELQQESRNLAISISSFPNYEDHNIVGISAPFVGPRVMNSLLLCIKKLKKTKRKNNRGVVQLGRIGIQKLIRSRSHETLIYSTSHYSDAVAFDPLIGNYKALILVRHPLDRIIAATKKYSKTSISVTDNYFNMSISDNHGGSWLYRKKMYTYLPKETANEFFISLGDKDALLYGIYIASLYYSNEMEDINTIRNLTAKNADFVKLEDIYSNPAKSLTKMEDILHLGRNATTNCKDGSMLFDLENANDGSISSQYNYKSVFKCVHYQYFEQVIGIHALKAYGYEDDLEDYFTNKNNACSDKQQQFFSAPTWPIIDLIEFRAHFTDYEFKLQKLSRLSYDKSYQSRVRSFDRQRVENHIATTISDTSISDRGNLTSRDLNPIEIAQILQASKDNMKCSRSHHHERKVTFEYLRYINGTIENLELLSSGRRDKLQKDDIYPITSEGSWVAEFCPEVIAYFEKYDVKYFDFHPSNDNVPLTTTEAAITMVCLLKVVDKVAKYVGVNWATIAGTQIGGILHGGPIPWDDDIDLVVDANKFSEFMEAFMAFENKNYRIECRNDPEDDITHKARRCYMASKFGPSPYIAVPGKKIYWPFIDIFSYVTGKDFVFEYADVTKKQQSDIQEGHKRRSLNSKVWRLEDFLPFRQTFYGGIMIPSLRYEIGALHYDVKNCFSGSLNHRVNRNVRVAGSPYIRHKLDCCAFRKYFPFIRRLKSEFDDSVTLEILLIHDRLVHLSRVNRDTQQVVNSFTIHREETDEGTFLLNYTFHSSGDHVDITNINAVQL